MKQAMKKISWLNLFEQNNICGQLSQYLIPPWGINVLYSFWRSNRDKKNALFFATKLPFEPLKLVMNQTEDLMNHCLYSKGDWMAKAG